MALTFATAVFRSWGLTNIGVRYVDTIPVKDVWLGRGKSKISPKPSFAKNVTTAI